MASFTWGPVGAAQTWLSTELNSLASGSASAYSAEIDNSSGPDLATLWFHIPTNSLAFTTSSYVSVYIVPSTTPDAAGGAYPTFTSGSSFKLALDNYWVGNIWINPTTQSANVVDEVLPFVQLQSGFFKVILVNNTGVTINSTGCTLKAYGTPTKVV